MEELKQLYEALVEQGFTDQSYEDFSSGLKNVPGRADEVHTYLKTTYEDYSLDKVGFYSTFGLSLPDNEQTPTFEAPVYEGRSASEHPDVSGVVENLDKRISELDTQMYSPGYTFEMSVGGAEGTVQMQSDLRELDLRKEERDIIASKMEAVDLGTTPSTERPVIQNTKEYADSFFQKQDPSQFTQNQQAFEKGLQDGVRQGEYETRALTQRRSQVNKELEVLSKVKAIPDSVWGEYADLYRAIQSDVLDGPSQERMIAIQKQYPNIKPMLELLIEDDELRVSYRKVLDENPDYAKELDRQATVEAKREAWATALFGVAGGTPVRQATAAGASIIMNVLSGITSGGADLLGSVNQEYDWFDRAADDIRRSLDPESYILTGRTSEERQGPFSNGAAFTRTLFDVGAQLGAIYLSAGAASTLGGSANAIKAASMAPVFAQVYDGSMREAYDTLGPGNLGSARLLALADATLITGIAFAVGGVERGLANSAALRGLSNQVRGNAGARYLKTLGASGNVELSKQAMLKAFTRGWAKSSPVLKDTLGEGLEGVIEGAVQNLNREVVNMTDAGRSAGGFSIDWSVGKFMEDFAAEAMGGIVGSFRHFGDRGNPEIFRAMADVYLDPVVREKVLADLSQSNPEAYAAVGQVFKELDEKAGSEGPKNRSEVLKLMGEVLSDMPASELAPKNRVADEAVALAAEANRSDPDRVVMPDGETTFVRSEEGWVIEGDPDSQVYEDEVVEEFRRSVEQENEQRLADGDFADNHDVIGQEFDEIVPIGTTVVEEAEVDPLVQEEEALEPREMTTAFDEAANEIPSRQVRNFLRKHYRPKTEQEVIARLFMDGVRMTPDALASLADPNYAPPSSVERVRMVRNPDSTRGNVRGEITPVGEDGLVRMVMEAGRDAGVIMDEDQARQAISEYAQSGGNFDAILQDGYKSERAEQLREEGAVTDPADIEQAIQQEIEAGAARGSDLFSGIAAAEVLTDEEMQLAERAIDIGTDQETGEIDLESALAATNDDSVDPESRIRARRAVRRFVDATNEGVASVEPTPVKESITRSYGATDVDQVIEDYGESEFSGDIVSALKVLSAMVPDVRISVVSDKSEMVAAIKRLELDGAALSKEILRAMEDPNVSINGIRSGNTIIISESSLADPVVFHEAIHIVASMAMEANPEFLRKAVDSLRGLPGSSDVRAWAESLYVGEAVDLEFVVETLARVAKGDIPINRPAHSKFRNFVNQIAETLGIRSNWVVLDASGDVLEFADNLRNAFIYKTPVFVVGEASSDLQRSIASHAPSNPVEFTPGAGALSQSFYEALRSDGVPLSSFLSDEMKQAFPSMVDVVVVISDEVQGYGSYDSDSRTLYLSPRIDGKGEELVALFSEAAGQDSNSDSDTIEAHIELMDRETDPDRWRQLNQDYVILHGQTTVEASLSVLPHRDEAIRIKAKRIIGNNLRNPNSGKLYKEPELTQRMNSLRHHMMTKLKFSADEANAVLQAEVAARRTSNIDLLTKEWRYLDGLRSSLRWLHQRLGSPRRGVPEEVAYLRDQMRGGVRASVLKAMKRAETLKGLIADYLNNNPDDSLLEERIYAYQRGDRSVSLPLEIRAEVDKLMLDVSEMQTLLLQSGISPDSNQARMIKESMGVYLHRAYRAFEDRSWSASRAKRFRSFAKGLKKLYGKGLSTGDKALSQFLEQNKVFADALQSYKEIIERQRGEFVSDADALAALEGYVNEVFGKQRKSSRRESSQISQSGDAFKHRDLNWTPGVNAVFDRLPRKGTEAERRAAYKKMSKKVKDQLLSDVYAAREAYMKAVYPELKRGTIAYEAELNRLINEDIENIVTGNAFKVAWLGPPPAIRKLLGEYSDPLTAYVSTIQKLANAAYAARMQRSLEILGDGVFLSKGSPEPGKDYVKVVTASSGPLKVLASDHSSAPDDGAVDNPRQDVYMDREVANFLDLQYSAIDRLPDRVGKFFEKLGLTEVAQVKMVSGLVNMGKTVLSPYTHFKNFASSHYLMGSLGYLRGKDYLTAISATILGDSDAHAELLEEMQRLDIIDQSITVNFLDDWLQSGQELQSLDAKLNRTDKAAVTRTQKIHDYLLDKKLPKKAKALFEESKRLYSEEDNWAKVYGYLIERNDYSKALYGKAYKDLNEAQKGEVRKVASEIVKSTQPMYGKLGGLGRYLGSSGIVGSFPSFSLEMWRNTYNTLALAVNEIQSGNQGLVKKGVGRLIGSFGVFMARNSLRFLMAQAAANALSSFGDEEDGFLDIVLALIGVDQDSLEEKDAISRFVPPWVLYGSYTYARDPQSGVRYVIDNGSMDPYSVIDKSFNQVGSIFSRVRSGEEINAGKEIGNVLSTYAGPTVFANAFLQLATGTDSYGRKIVPNNSPTADKLYAHVENFWRITQPGVAKAFFYDFPKDVDRSDGKAADVLQYTLMRAVGANIYDYPDDQLARAVRYKLGEDSSWKGGVLNSKFYDKVIQGDPKAQNVRLRALERMKATVLDARRLGVDENLLREEAKTGMSGVKYLDRLYVLGDLKEPVPPSKVGARKSRQRKKSPEGPIGF